MRSFLLIIVIFSCYGVNAQRDEKFACDKASRVLVRKYFENIQQHNEILQKIYKVQNDRKTTRIPFCWHGCAVSLPKPVFSIYAKQIGLFGKVRIETIADESGKIFYARAVDGPSVFRRDAEMAACASRFTPILFDGKPIPYRWSIVYNFIW